MSTLKTHSRIWDNFWQLKALQKWWKMLFFHVKSSFRSRYIRFCSDFLVMWKNGLIRKLWLISKFMTSKTEQQLIAIHILPNIQRSKGNQAMKFSQLIKYDIIRLMRVSFAIMTAVFSAVHYAHDCFYCNYAGDCLLQLCWWQLQVTILSFFLELTPTFHKKTFKGIISDLHFTTYHFCKYSSKIEILWG